MHLTPGPTTGTSLLLIEGGLTVILLAVAFALPRMGSPLFARIERAFARLARRKRLSVLLVGVSALVLRLAILPFCPIPLPFVQDDFSFLLSANTFALGRLTNPTPAMWVHFESFAITLRPTYMSMYFPGQGLILAAGKVLFGHPWFGLLIVTALLCAAFCWMLQAWLPPSWALLGGVLVILRLGLFSYWINTYSGAASLAALGGALVLGAFPRFKRSRRFRDALLAAVGAILLAYSRPYEGMILCLVVLSGLGYWALFGKNRLKPSQLLLRMAAPLALVAATLAWLGYYDYRVFGNPRTLPYTVQRITYAAAPYWIWQAPPPQPTYNHEDLREFFVGVELTYAKHIQTVPGFLSETLLFKPFRTLMFFAGIALLPPLFMLSHVFKDRRIRFLVICVFVVVCGAALETFTIPHHFAAVSPAFYAIGLQMMRHLRQWKPGGQPIGAALLRFTVFNCLALAALRLGAEPLHLRLAYWPSGAWTSLWSGPGQAGLPRALIQQQLEQMHGKQLVIVRYPAGHNTINDWVYNDPDIDNSKVIWAREMDAAQDADLIRYYNDRKVWLLHPDNEPATLTTYTPATQQKSPSH